MNKQFHIIIFAVLSSISCVLLSSCGNSESEQKEVYKKVYQKGYEDGVNKGMTQMKIEIENTTSNIRHNVRDKIANSMIIGGLIFVLITLFGPVYIDKFRIKVADHLKLTLEKQMALATTAYIIVFITALLWIFNHYAFTQNLSILILMAGTIYPFWGGYIPALQQDNKMLRRLNMGKVKSLGFFALTLIMVYNILENGIGGIL